MSSILQLSKRHMKTYLRDKTSVFFSFLSVIILLGIYLLFMGNMIPTNSSLTSAENSRFVLGYIMGGVIVIATLTIPLGVIGSYVSDLESKRFNSFMVMPVKRRVLTLSYFVSTFVVSLFFVMLMFFATVIYIGINTGIWFSALEVLTGVGMVGLFLTVSVPIIFFLVSFIKSSNAFGGLSSLVGTLIGFISGIYIPLTVLDNFTKSLAALLPFSHMTIYMKRLFIGNNIISKLPHEALEASAINPISVFGLNIPPVFLFIGFLAFSAMFLVFSYLKMNRKRAD